MNVATHRQSREQQFWDEHTSPLEACIAEYRQGPDPNTVALIDALEPLVGSRVLDLGCGSGLLSAWLSMRGAIVTAVDLSPQSIARATELFDALGLTIECLCAAFPSSALDGRLFDRLAGRYVLHHLDLATAAGALAELMPPEGRAAFLETMATNPLLTLARRRLVGRYGIPRYGTVDERPLSRRDLSLLSETVGPIEIVVSEMHCARLLDRQLLAYRHPRISRGLGAIDGALLGLGLKGASYHQVLIMDRGDAGR